MYLFIGLYSLYGVVDGLCNSVRVLMGDRVDASPILQSTLSLFHWSPLIAMFLAPVVEAIHVPYVGRRKTWIVGAQYAVGAVMLLMLPFSGAETNDVDLPLGVVSVVLLALCLCILQLLAAVHEIATDAWGKSYVHHKYGFVVEIFLFRVYKTTTAVKHRGRNVRRTHTQNSVIYR